jgi:type IV pilus assembly protein PilW
VRGGIKMMKMRHLSHKGGFTLVEIMIALLISSIVMISIFAAFQSQQQSYLIQEQVAEMQQNIRAGLGMMTREIRMAGYDPAGGNGVGFITATSTSVNFSHIADYDGLDNDGDATTDEVDEVKIITYSLYDAYADGDTDLGRLVGTVATARRPVAEDIDEIEFFYTMNNGTTTTAPGTLADIRSVQISILAKAGKPDRNFVNTATYTPASQIDILVPDPDDLWGPYDDNFRRRLLICTVRCRNMGLI